MISLVRSPPFVGSTFSGHYERKKVLFEDDFLALPASLARIKVTIRAINEVGRAKDRTQKGSLQPFSLFFRLSILSKQLSFFHSSYGDGYELSSSIVCSGNVLKTGPLCIPMPFLGQTRNTRTVLLPHGDFF